jgi:hypothetical protein
VVGVVGSREERRGQNEALFRQVNEHIVELDDRFDIGVVEILCECSQLDCSEPLKISRSAYETVRRSGTRFILVDGHADPSIERVVGGDSYLIVEKIGDAADAAIANPA